MALWQLLWSAGRRETEDRNGRAARSACAHRSAACPGGGARARPARAVSGHELLHLRPAVSIRFPGLTAQSAWTDLSTCERDRSRDLRTSSVRSASRISRAARSDRLSMQASIFGTVAAAEKGLDDGQRRELREHSRSQL